MITGASESCYFPVILVRKNMGKYLKPTLLDFKAIMNVSVLNAELAQNSV